MREAIENRISRRTYIDEYLESEEYEKIESLVARANEESGLTIALIKDGSEAFKGIKRSYGLFKGVRALLLLKGPSRDENLEEKLGYFGERLVLDLTDMNLGTCWVGGTYDKSVFPILEEERLVAVITLGHVTSQTVKEKMIKGMISRKRKSVEERCSSDAPLPSWVYEGIEAVRLAPSAVNSQKPHFVYKDGVVSASVDVTTPYDLVDLGIAKFHFAEVVGGEFSVGNPGVFSKN